jgi:hypothetical protein
MLLESLRTLGLLPVTALFVLNGCSEGTDDVIAQGTGGGSNTSSCPDAEVQGDPLFSFDVDREGFSFETYAADPPYKNLAYSTDNPYDERALLTWSGDELGVDGEPGVMVVFAPYGDYDEVVDVQNNLDESIDWTGKTLRAYVKVLDGFVTDENAPGGAYIFLKTGDDYVYGRGAWINLDPACIGSWIELEFRVDLPDDSNEGFDPSESVSIGIQIATGQGPANPDPNNMPQPAHVLIDQITVE